MARVGGAAAVPGLRRLLTQSPQEEVREAAARTLALLGPAARPAIPELVRAAKGDSDAALIALVDLGASEASSVAAPKATTSSVAAHALLRLGAAGLAEIGRRLHGDEDVSIVIHALDHGADDVVVGKLGADILFAIRNLKSTHDRLALAEVMLRRGPPGARSNIRAALQDLRRSRDKRVHERAERVLAMAGDEAAMRAWVPTIGREDRGIDWEGFRAVCQMGSRAAPALARLTKLARAEVTDDWANQTQAVEAIGCIGTPATVPLLVEALRSPSHHTAKAAASALERIAPADAEAPLREVAGAHWHPAVRDAAARALAAVQGHRLPAPAPSPVRRLPPGETFACYGEGWPAAVTSTVRVDEDKPRPIPSELSGIKDLTSYLAVPRGWLATASSGEWGGGLYLVGSGRREAVKISSGHFHYVVSRAGGLVAVDGIGHMGVDRGALWRVEPRQGHFVARPWLELPSRPWNVRESKGDLLVVDTDLGPLAIDPGGRIATGPCRPLAAEAKEILQALLDDSRLRAALARQHAPAPLPLGLWRIEEETGGLTFQGRAVRPQRGEPAALDAGSFLELSGLQIDPSAAKAEVHFAYPDLAFGGEAAFTRTHEGWRVAGVRIAPLEDGLR